MENDQTDQLLFSPESVVSRTKRWYEHKIILLLIGLLLIVCLASLYFIYKQSKKIPNPNENIVNSISQTTTSLKQEFKSPTSSLAAIICSAEPQASGQYQKGEVIVFLPTSIFKTHSHKYIEDLGYNFMDMPTDTSKPIEEDWTKVYLNWSDNFIEQNRITLEEVNNLLLKAAQKKYVKNIKVHKGWLTSSDQASDQSRAQILDRWGLITFTFFDQYGATQLLKDYPELTFFSDGRADEREREFIIQPGVYEVTVAYKAQAVLDILNKIKDQVLSKDYHSRNTKYPDGSEGFKLDIIPEIGYKDNLTNFSLIVAATKELKFEELTSAYPELVPKLEQMSFGLIKAPVGKEECYARELDKQIKEWAATLPGEPVEFSPVGAEVNGIVYVDLGDEIK